jgi:hypothetical protein
MSLVFLLAVIFTVFKIVMHETHRIGERLRELEAEINSIAGERLLRWETDHGLVKRGLFS